MADKPIAAIDYLAKAEKYPPPAVCALFGDETFLRRQAILALRGAVLGGGDGDFSLTTFEGRGTQLRDVLDELSTVAMFGGRRRLVVVEGADDFVSRWRAELEDYVSRPGRNGVLVLDLKTMAANTRLYKMIAAEGLLIDCRPPAPARLTKWLIDRASRRHDFQLSPAAADALTEIVGPELGLLDQELAKLALLVGEDRKIAPETIERNVGGWRARTTWEMLDAALDGKVAEAMLQLDRLLCSGEQPIGILAQISASLRRFAAATRLVLQAEAGRKRANLRAALEQAGVRPFVLQKAERQLRLLGRRRGAKLHRWLLKADLDLKGESAMPPRLILERLILRISAPQAKAP
ncbi:MAG: DNA polymerase III subunit delta [Pirellulales bacterium]|nr:DNA polymerase III subunit delta [Pirellulales bacterium]